MTDEMIERFLEALEDTSFPIQVDWNNKEFYIEGFRHALQNSGLKLVETRVAEQN